MANYTPNEVVDILLVLRKCHKNYKNASRYLNRRHPNPQQVINIERKSHQNPLHR